MNDQERIGRIPEPEPVADELAEIGTEILNQIAGIRTDLDQVLAAGTNQAFVMTALMERAEPVAELARRVDDLDIAGAVRNVAMTIGLAVVALVVVRHITAN